MFILPLLIATSFVEFGHTWQIREGDIGAGSPWSPSGITRFTRNAGPDGLTNRRVGLNAEDASAGVKLMDVVAPAKVTVYLEGDLYTQDPNNVVAVWFYDDRPGMLGGLELDWEFSAWGDTHSPYRHDIGYWNRGVKGIRSRAPATTALYHKIELVQTALYSSVKVWDWRDSDSRWIEIISKRYDVVSQPGATLRIGLWRNGPHRYPPSRRGQSRVWIGGVTTEAPF